MTVNVAAKVKGFRCHINAKSHGILRLPAGRQELMPSG